MRKNIILILVFILALAPLNFLQADSVASQASGKILLQVESEGEGWYINPENKKRYFLGRPADAFNIMRQLGSGIATSDLKRVPVAVESLSGEDSDGDGLPNSLERALNTNTTKKDSDGDGFDDKMELENNYDPNQEAELPIDPEFVKKSKGKIFLQVEDNGEAWYVNPEDGKRYFLGKPRDAFAIMRNLGLGVKNEDLKKIPQASIEQEPTEEKDTSESSIATSTPAPTSSPYDLSKLETALHNLVNQKRTANGLDEVDRNKEVAAVAREHSQNLAEENKNFTGLGNFCDLPMLHNEGRRFGLYSNNRMNNRGVNYFSQAGENLALVSASIDTTKYEGGTQNPASRCRKVRNNLNTQFKNDLNSAETKEEKKQVIKQEIEDRKEVFNNMESIKITSKRIKDRQKVARDIVQGWMNSPPHRENMLQESYNEAGMGVAYVNGYLIVTQVFIKRIDCGYEGGACCEEEGYYPYCYKPLKCEDGTCVSTSTTS